MFYTIFIIFTNNILYLLNNLCNFLKIKENYFKLYIILNFNLNIEFY